MLSVPLLLIFPVLLANAWATRQSSYDQPWPQPEKLLGFWPLNSKYNVQDIGPNHYNGELQTQDFTVGPFGVSETAAVPTADNTKLLRVNSPNVSIEGSSFTVSLFFKRGGTAVNGGIFEFLDQTSYTSTRAFQFRYENATTFELSANSATIGHIPMIEQNGGWTYIAMVYNHTDGTLTIYGQNGLVLAPTPKPQLKLSLASSNNGLRLGYSTRFARGLTTSDAVACLVVYSAALTSDDVLLVKDSCQKAGPQDTTSTSIQTTIITTTVPENTSPTDTTIMTTRPDPATIERLQVQLQDAAKTGDLDRLRKLLALGFLDTNWWRDDGEDCPPWPCVSNATALIHAAHRNPRNLNEVVRLLVQNGADVNAREAIKKRTALIWTGYYGNLDAVRMLVERGADVNANDVDGWTALVGAAGCFTDENEEIVRLLLERGADVNATTTDSWTPLLRATITLHRRSVRMLLDRSAFTDAKTKDGQTPLMIVSGSMQGSSEIVQMLLDKGADINAKDNDGKTALIGAARYGQLTILRILLGHGADADLKTNSGTTALIEASQEGQLGVVEELLNAGADINAKSNFGWTALMYAALHRKVDVVRLLLNRGASRDGCTPEFSLNCNLQF